MSGMSNSRLKQFRQINVTLTTFISCDILTVIRTYILGYKEMWTCRNCPEMVSDLFEMKRPKGSRFNLMRMAIHIMDGDHINKLSTCNKRYFYCWLEPWATLYLPKGGRWSEDHHSSKLLYILKIKQLKKLNRLCLNSKHYCICSKTPKVTIA